MYTLLHCVCLVKCGGSLAAMVATAVVVAAVAEVLLHSTKWSAVIGWNKGGTGIVTGALEALNPFQQSVS